MCIDKIEYAPPRIKVVSVKCKFPILNVSNPDVNVRDWEDGGSSEGSF